MKPIKFKITLHRLEPLTNQSPLASRRHRQRKKMCIRLSTIKSTRSTHTYVVLGFQSCRPRAPSVVPGTVCVFKISAVVAAHEAQFVNHTAVACPAAE